MFSKCKIQNVSNHISKISVPAKKISKNKCKKVDFFFSFYLIENLLVIITDIVFNLLNSHTVSITLNCPSSPHSVYLAPD